MTWRGTITPLDRLYGCLPYILPMAASVAYGFFLFSQAPFLAYFYLPFLWIEFLLKYPIIPNVLSLDFVTFICLYIFVVRNERIKHFIRFNAMQALLLGIVLVLIEICTDLISPALSVATVQQLSFIIQIFANTIFIGMTAVCAYCVFQTIRGVYAEVPIVSEAAYYQTRY